MGWGNIGLSWTRYAKGKPTRHCMRCNLDFFEEEGSCPYCSAIEDQELENYLHALEEKKKNTRIFIALVTSLLLYVIIVLFILPMYVQ